MSVYSNFPLTAALELAQEILRAGEDLRPMLVIEGEIGVTIVDLAQGWGDQRMRRAVLQDVGANVGRQFKAHRAVLVTDAWAVRVPRGEGGEAPEHGGIRPSQDPRRFEVVIISELLPNGCGTSLHCEYKRSTDGDAGSVVFEEPYEMPIRTDYTFDAFFDGVRGVTNKGDA